MFFVLYMNTVWHNLPKLMNTIVVSHSLKNATWRLRIYVNLKYLSPK